MTMKHQLLLSLCLLLAAAGAHAAGEQTDVTAQYVANASFEQDNIGSLSPKTEQADGLRGYVVTAPKGWTVSNSAGAVSLIVTKDCYTDNDFGRVTTLADGTQAYYLRLGWSTGTTTVQQTIASLPKGKYQLQASVRSAYANQAASAFGLMAGAQSSSIAFVTTYNHYTSQATFGCNPYDAASVAAASVRLPHRLAIRRLLRDVRPCASL